MNWIIQNGKQILVILINVLYILGIITNLISVWKLDLKDIYWCLNNQTLCIINTQKKVGISRVVRDLYLIVTDLQKNAFLLGTYIVLAIVTVLQLVELLYNCLDHLNLEDICKLIYVTRGIKICN